MNNLIVESYKLIFTSSAGQGNTSSVQITGDMNGSLMEEFSEEEKLKK
jgi:hypothetical protein